MKKVSALIIALALMFSMSINAFALGDDPVSTATIDYNSTASLSIYKYDITRASADGVWDTESYVSSGQYDQNVIDVLGNPNVTNTYGANDPSYGYAIKGVEFTYLKVAEISTLNLEPVTGEHTVITLYGFDKNASSEALLSAIGLGYDDAYSAEGNTCYFSSDALNSALATALAGNNVSVKNAFESFIKTNNGTAMTATDAYGHTSASELPLGLYLLMEMKVPDYVTITCNPFFVSLPMTSIDGSTWNYDVTICPKNQTGMPTLDKTVREGLSDTGTREEYKHTASASDGDVVEYQIKSTLPTITSAASALTEYSFLDTLSLGIIYNKSDVTISFYKDKSCTELLGTWDEASGKFAVAYNDLSNGSTMTISMTDAGLSEINTSTEAHEEGSLTCGYSDCTMVIDYSCTLKSDTSVIYGDGGNPNKVKLTWRRTNTEFFDTLEDDAHVYSYGIDLTKQFSDGLGKFERVQFVLQNKTDNYYVKAVAKDGVYFVTDHVSKQSEATVFVPDKNGHIIVKGVEDDVYIATEVKTDEGYTLLKNNIEISITSAEGDECTVCHKPLLTSGATVNGTATKMNVGSATLTVVNVKGFELPKTGSYGTWIFTTGGVLAMGVAVVLMVKLIRKKKAM